MEGTLGDPGKDRDHGVGPVLLVLAREAQHVSTVLEEGAPEKTVHEENVADHVRKVEHLGKQNKD